MILFLIQGREAGFNGGFPSGGGVYPSGSGGYDYNNNNINPVYGPPIYGPPQQAYGPPPPLPPSGYGAPLGPSGYGYPSGYGQMGYGLPGHWLLDKLKLKLDIFTVGKILLKLLIFKKIVKFFAIICLLLFLPKLKHDNGDSHGSGEENYRIIQNEGNTFFFSILISVFDSF